MTLRVWRVAVLVLAAVWPRLVSAEEPAPTRIERDGLRMELAPLQSDQVRAFFLARGYSPGDAEHIVETACLFRSAIGSARTAAGDPEIGVALTEWRVKPAGGRVAAPMVREDWEALWKARGAPEDATTAFYWALFPTEQTFGPTDYNWGFLTFAMPPGTRFDLEIVWTSAGKTHTATIEALTCAK